MKSSINNLISAVLAVAIIFGAYFLYTVVLHYDAGTATGIVAIIGFTAVFVGLLVYGAKGSPKVETKEVVKIRCKNCGQLNLETTTVCEKCGEKL